MSRHRILHRSIGCARPSERLSPVLEDGVGLLPACGRGLHILKRTDRLVGTDQGTQDCPGDRVGLPIPIRLSTPKLWEVWRCM